MHSQENLITKIADAMNTLGAKRRRRRYRYHRCGKTLLSGGDIKRFKMLVDTKTYLKAEDIEAIGAMPMAIRNCPKPVIAMVKRRSHRCRIKLRPLPAISVL